METPRVIWQTWKSKTDIPGKLFDLSRTWTTNHPDYKYHLLDDDDLRNIVSKVTPKHLEKYDSFTRMIERVDFARYAIMYEYGGVYADMDTKSLKNVDVWVAKNKIVLGCEPSEHSMEIYKTNRVVCNALIISPPKQKFWLELMDYISENYEWNYAPVYNTGPMAITKFLDTHPRYERELLITDPCVFYPIKGDGKTISEGCNLDDSYVAHMWENTWVTKWYQDDRWFNIRYWTYAIFLVYIVMWLWLYFSA